MPELSMPWISLTVFTPLLGAILLAAVPREHREAHRYFTLFFMGLTFVFSTMLVGLFDSAEAGYQLTSRYENLAWIEALGVRYHVGVDGISLWLILLTTFLGPIVVLSGYRAIDTRVKEYHIALLVLQTAMLGALVALDLFLFYIFWELMLVPLYLLVGVWGGPQRIYAAVKLFLYTMVGSVLMLIGILYIYFKGDAVGFGIDTMMAAARTLTLTEQSVLFAAFGLAFAIKIPVFPFHTWLPDAHVQAPTAGSVILASVLLKLGVYGLMRYAIPFFPNAVVAFAPLIAVLSIIGIIYGAVVAYVQTDIKKLVAYSSVSHLGFVTLGLLAMTPEAVTGALYQSLAHGISTGGLFLGIGIIYERRHTREMSEFGGLAKQLPLFSVFFLIIVFGSAGAPGLVGFVGEYLILFGTAKSGIFDPAGLQFFRFVEPGFGPQGLAFWFTILAATGVILGALYLLWMVQKMLFGPLDNEKNASLSDLNAREVVYMLPIVVMCFVMGIFPRWFTKDMDASIERFIGDVNGGVSAEYHPEYVQWLQRAERNYALWTSDTVADEPFPMKADSHGGHGGGHGDDGHEGDDEHGSDDGDGDHGDDHGEGGE